jgi:hypothetical protein
VIASCAHKQQSLTKKMLRAENPRAACLPWKQRRRRSSLLSLAT